MTLNLLTIKTTKQIKEFKILEINRRCFFKYYSYTTSKNYKTILIDFLFIKVKL